MDKAGWNSNRTHFRTSLLKFQSAVERLAHEMFQTDDIGDLPVYVRIVDRTAFRAGKNETFEPYDIGLSKSREAEAVLDCIGEEDDG